MHSNVIYLLNCYSVLFPDVPAARVTKKHTLAYCIYIICISACWRLHRLLRYNDENIVIPNVLPFSMRGERASWSGEEF
jgi:hypothetical protein